MEEVDEHDSGGRRRAALVLVGLLVAALIAGLATLGLGGPEEPKVSTGSGCQVHALKYTVTDSADEFAEQKRFEQTQADVTAPGFYRAPVAKVPVLHAASHAYVVVFYRDDLSDAATNELRALNERAVQTKAPLVIAPRDQGDALVAIASGYELACGDDTLADAAEVTRFAAQTYASVADPRATTPPQR